MKPKFIAEKKLILVNPIKVVAFHVILIVRKTSFTVEDIEKISGLSTVVGDECATSKKI